MKRHLLAFVLSLCGFLSIATVTFAQNTPTVQQDITPKEEYVKAQVIEILHESTSTISGYKTVLQSVKLQILEGSKKNAVVTVQKESDLRIADTQKVAVGEVVILDIISQPGNVDQYTIADIYRLDKLAYILAIFFVFILLAVGKKGVGSILGLVISFGVILTVIVPPMLHGYDPLTISILGCFIILLVTTYLAHGFSKQTTVAIISTFLALLATMLFSYIAVQLTHLAGLGTEDSYILEISPGLGINPKGLLLGGILIGTLGALNDITTTQVAAIVALFKSNSKMSAIELAEHGFFIGREHIVSLVNTLLLAYAGSSLPIFIFFILNPSHLPVWVIINNESVAEELVRTVAGSIGLILAIPITTLLATWIFYRHQKSF